jgi:hypothetical protein
MLKIVRVYESDEKCVEFPDVRRVERLASGQVRLEQCLDASAPAGPWRDVLLPPGTTCDITRDGLHESVGSYPRL